MIIVLEKHTKLALRAFLIKHLYKNLLAKENEQSNKNSRTSYNCNTKFGRTI